LQYKAVRNLNYDETKTTIFLSIEFKNIPDLFSLSVDKFTYCCDGKARAAKCASFTLWQQATIEITRRDHSIIACSCNIYMVLFFAHIPFVVNRTFNATPPERLQQRSVDDSELPNHFNNYFSDIVSVQKHQERLAEISKKAYLQKYHSHTMRTSIGQLS